MKENIKEISACTSAFMKRPKKDILGLNSKSKKDRSANSIYQVHWYHQYWRQENFKITTNGNPQQLSRVEVSYGEGTIKVCPNPFYQLHAEVYGQVVTLV